MTNGAKWIARAHKRIAGWCKTRGWRCGPPFVIGRSQLEVTIKDCFGATGYVVFDDSSEPNLIDECGRYQDFDAVTFDAMLEPFALAPKPLVSKRQLSLQL